MKKMNGTPAPKVDSAGTRAEALLRKQLLRKLEERWAKELEEGDAEQKAERGRGLTPATKKAAAVWLRVAREVVDEVLA